MDINIKNNIDEVQRGLNDFARRQMPFATSLAINDVLGQIKRNTERRMRRVLDRPTPFTMKAFAIRRASKRRLVGSVFAKDVQAEYLQYAETGGTRRPQRRAVLVPVGERLNKYGNMARGAVGRAIASPKVFSGAPKGRPGAGGIYQRMGKGRTARLKLLVHYAASAGYRKRLGFKTGAQKTGVIRMPDAFLRAMDRAIKSAR